MTPDLDFSGVFTYMMFFLCRLPRYFVVKERLEVGYHFSDFGENGKKQKFNFCRNCHKHLRNGQIWGYDVILRQKLHLWPKFERAVRFLDTYTGNSSKSWVSENPTSNQRLRYRPLWNGSNWALCYVKCLVLSCYIWFWGGVVAYLASYSRKTCFSHIL
jgi:hypothetical protein